MSVIVFLMIRIIPGDPAMIILGLRSTPENIQTLRAGPAARRSALGAVRALAGRRAAGRSGGRLPHPRADPRSTAVAVAGDVGDGGAGDADVGRAGAAARSAGGDAAGRGRAWHAAAQPARDLDSRLLAGGDADSLRLARAGVAALLRLRAAAGVTVGEPESHAAAGVDAGPQSGGGAGANGAHRRPRRARPAVRAHGAGQGFKRAGGRRRAHRQERGHPGDHGDGVAARLRAGGSDHHRADLRPAGRRTVDVERRAGAELPGGAGSGAADHLQRDAGNDFHRLPLRRDRSAGTGAVRVTNERPGRHTRRLTATGCWPALAELAAVAGAAAQPAGHGGADPGDVDRHRRRAGAGDRSLRSDVRRLRQHPGRADLRSPRWNRRVRP